MEEDGGGHLHDKEVRVGVLPKRDISRIARMPPGCVRMIWFLRSAVRRYPIILA